MGNVFAHLFARLWSKANVRILMLGLDASGKTTVLFKLKLGEVMATIPTIGFNVETVEYKNINFTVWDVGGQTAIRKLWDYYYAGTRALIYVVDSSDRGRIEESREVLHYLLTHDQLRDTVVLVLANKQDMATAMHVAELSTRLGLHELPASRAWHVQASCATSGAGLYEGLDWVSRQL